MTALGAVFLAAYLVGMATFKRLGVLVVAAAAIPFNDSAALLLSRAPITPFYLGMLIYLPLAFYKVGIPRLGSSLPWVFGASSIAITLLGPTLYSGMPVVASGIGIDQQVGRLTALSYSTSNFAQIIYLVFNLALLLVLPLSGDAKRWIPTVPATIGTLVAMTAWMCRQTGIPWPEDFFRNNTENAYAYVETPRLSAQFSEASHLGAFALTSAVLLGSYVLILRPKRAVAIGFLCLAVADVLLVIETGSATALAGAAIFGLILLGWAFYRIAINEVRLPLVSWLTVFATACVAVFFVPFVISYAQYVFEYKLDRGTSIRSRTAADITSWYVFLDTKTIGVGLGSNRSSSLLLLLLSTIGLLGTVLFLLLMGRAIRDGLRVRERRVWAASLVVLLASAFFSFADLVSPMMWLLAGFCWKVGSNQQISDSAATSGDELLSQHSTRPLRQHRFANHPDSIANKP